MCCCLWEVTELSWAAFALKATDLWNAQKNSRSIYWNSSWPGGTGHRAMRRHLTARCWYWPLHLFPFALPALATAHSHPLSELSVSWFESLKLASNTCKLDCFNCLILKKQIDSCRGQGNIRYGEKRKTALLSGTEREVWKRRDKTSFSRDKNILVCPCCPRTVVLHHSYSPILPWSGLWILKALTHYQLCKHITSSFYMLDKNNVLVYSHINRH